VSLSHKTNWTLYRSQSSTNLHQTCHQGRVPEDVVIYSFRWKSERRISAKPEVELIFTCSYEKTAFMSNISKTVTDTTMESVEVKYETNPGLSVGTMTFDLGWPWTVIDLGHKTCTLNISNAVRDTMLDTIEVIHETTNELSAGTVTCYFGWS